MDRPRLVGDGPATCSTSMEIERVPTVIWDTNRYYADLGVGVRATRADIRKAYLERGQSSPRLTYVAKQLLNPVVRAAYDRTPLGSVFFDAEVESVLRRALALRVSGTADRLERLDRVDVLDTLATLTPDILDRGRLVSEAPPTAWPFAFYLWGTDQADTARLREWQELLVRALGRQREHLQIAVGLIGGVEQPVVVHRVGYRVVVFLRDDEGPTDALAMRAVSRLEPIRSQEIQECRPRPSATSARAQRLRPKPPRAAAPSPRPTSSASTGTPPVRRTRPSSGS